MKTRALKLFLILGFVLVCGSTILAQDRFVTIKQKLEMLSAENIGLSEKVEASINNTPLTEFVRAMGSTNNLNISVDPSIKAVIVQNFSNVSVSDVLIYLCKKYDLDINFVGNIMSIVPYVTPAPPAVVVAPRRLNINYDSAKDMLGYDLKSDTLFAVAKEITKLSGKNIVIAPGVGEKMVSGFIQNMPFENALQKLVYANDLKLSNADDKTFMIEKKDVVSNEEQAGNGSGKKKNKSDKNRGQSNDKKSEDTEDLEVKYVDGKISLEASNVPMSEIVNAVFGEVGKNYFLFSELKGNTTLKVVDYTLDEFLKYLLNGTEFTFKADSNIYLIGDRSLEGLRSTKVVQLQNRTVDKLLDFIPADLKKGVEVKLFPELNSIILCGSSPRITEIEAFLREVDKKVPVIMIEVLMVDVKKNRKVSTGIKAGIKDTPVKTAGQIYPDVSMEYSGESVNNILKMFNGFGVFNLGRVTSNFYVNISALESQGVLEMRSIPKLATLNGHEAKLSIGKTEYYMELSNNIIGGIQSQTIVNQQYKSVNADLSLSINPIVSGGEYVTLDIKVQQSDFTGRVAPNAPPGTVKRDFQSMIQVKNQEMVVLGGLEEETNNNTGSGIPLLSRIPVLKWFFSSKLKEKSKSRLNIFIKPTIIY